MKIDVFKLKQPFSRCSCFLLVVYIAYNLTLTREEIFGLINSVTAWLR